MFLLACCVVSSFQSIMLLAPAPRELLLRSRLLFGNLRYLGPHWEPPFWKEWKGGNFDALIPCGERKYPGVHLGRVGWPAPPSKCAHRPPWLPNQYSGGVGDAKYTVERRCRRVRGPNAHFFFAGWLHGPNLHFVDWRHLHSYCL